MNNNIYFEEIIFYMEILRQLFTLTNFTNIQTLHRSTYSNFLLLTHHLNYAPTPIYSAEGIPKSYNFKILHSTEI